MIEETNGNPNYGYLGGAYKSIEVKSGMIKEVIIENQKQTGNLQIKKVDKDTGKPLKGVSFKIWDSNEDGWVIVNNQNRYENENVTVNVTGMNWIKDRDNGINNPRTTEFITDSNGQITINNLLCHKYYIWETSVGDNANYGYEVDGNYIYFDRNNDSSKPDNVPYTCIDMRDKSNIGNTAKLTCENRRKYVDLSRICLGR